MKQTVLIGLGGTGSRVVNNVARELKKRKVKINDGIVTCCVLDTNQRDNENITNSGTAIPVIATCENWRIEEYMNAYAHKSPGRWSPDSQGFLMQTMINGASEVRVKSRIAFMDTMATEKIKKLEEALEKVFHRRTGEPEQVRVMLVSSLAGGTGSGMFIQVALWLRKFFDVRGCEATIRGILLLPDIFVRTTTNIAEGPRKKLYHYANAYAAIRELNAINKVIKGNAKLEKPLIIDDLFDSDHPCKQPVFDNAFFIDDVDASGVAFKSLGEYEEIVAQIVYMQLYAPMVNEMISVEDNLFRACETNPEPVYGSCGTAKAEYPAADVHEYCALRAAQDAIADGWYKIDAEIDAMEKDAEEENGDGAGNEKVVVRRDMFIKLFDEMSSKTEDSVTKGNKLISTIKNDVFNEKREQIENSDEYQTIPTCKVEYFMNLLEKMIDRAVEDYGEYDSVRKAVSGILPDPDKTEKYTDAQILKLKGVNKKEKDAIENLIEQFDESCDDYASAIIRSMVPQNMGYVDSRDEGSLFGMFTKTDANGNRFTVHPVAARYLLFKLAKEIEARQNSLAPESKREKAKKRDKTSFDNPDTRKKETLDEYWEQMGRSVSQKEARFFVRTYRNFNKKNVELCKAYEVEALSSAVLKKLAEKVRQLTEEMDRLFIGFPEMVNSLKKSVQENIEKNRADQCKTLYVFANAEHKEAKYKSLRINLAGRVNSLSDAVMDAVYGGFCLRNRPNAEENQKYGQKTVGETFRDSIVQAFHEQIKKEYEKKIYLSIVEAIRQESDFDVEKQRAEIKDEDPYAVKETADGIAFRHKNAIAAYCGKLEHMSEPFLNAKSDAAMSVKRDADGVTPDESSGVWMRTLDGKVLYMPYQTKLTFWGFHPRLTTEYPDLEAQLGANKATAADVNYGINELFCYRSSYAIVAEAIPKFNELSGGDYYAHYGAVIKKIMAGGNELDTPHLDKTWHEFLPYVSAAKEKDVRERFFKTFWRAIAYGRITLSANGKYQLSRRVYDSDGEYEYESRLLKENGLSISKTDVAKLISALKKEPSFETTIADELDADFKKDMERMTLVKKCRPYKGLTVEGELNPVTMITRFCASAAPNSTIKTELMTALRRVMAELVKAKDANKDEEQLREAVFKLCFQVYERSHMVTKRDAVRGWVNEFVDMGLMEDVGDDDATSAGKPEEEDVF